MCYVLSIYFKMCEASLMSIQGSEKFNLEHGRNVMSPSAIIWKDGMLQPSPGASTLLKVDVCIVTIKVWQICLYKNLH